jgi:hypothetical protein
VETFIVRVWTPVDEASEGPPHGELHGVLERVRSKERTHFRSAGDLVRALRAGVTPTADSADGDRPPAGG